MKINKKHNVRVAFEENKIVHTCVCLNVNNVY